MRIAAGNPVLAVKERKTRAVGLPPDLMSVKDVSLALEVCMETVRRWIKTGKLRSWWVGRRQRVSWAEVRAVVEAAQLAPRRPPGIPDGLRAYIAAKAKARRAGTSQQ